MSKSSKNTYQHTRSIQVSRRIHAPSSYSPEKIESRLTEMLNPTEMYDLIAYFRRLGMRARILTLPVMLALVLSMIWRQLGSVSEAVRTLQKEGHLWVKPIKITQQAVSERLRTFPAELFQKVFEELLPKIQARFEQRKRLLNSSLQWAKERFTDVLIVDASTLDSIIKKVGLLRDSDETILGGKIVALLDVISQQPRKIWYDVDAAISEQRFWDLIKTQLQKGALLLFDMGFTNYKIFDYLSDLGINFITRAKRDTSYRVKKILFSTSNVRDIIIELGSGKYACNNLMRLVVITFKGRKYRYLTNVLDINLLPSEYVASIYRQRWRIEDVFLHVKRLLGLSYFYVGSSNGIQIQVWATWLLYSILIDLVDEVAERLNLSFNEVSVEMVFRGLYHYGKAYERGEANDPVEYLADNAKLLGIIKRKRNKNPKKRRLKYLDNSTFP